MSSEASGRSGPRRPAFFSQAAMEAQGGTVPDPAEIAEVAHATAAVLVGTGRASEDPAVTAKLVALVDELGLSTLAELWADRPARSLPGALWRLYALHEWVQRNPEEASADYMAGVRFTDVNHAVAGVAEPPGPQEMRSPGGRHPARRLRGRPGRGAAAGGGVLPRGLLRAGRPRPQHGRPRCGRCHRTDPSRVVPALHRRGPRGLRPAVARRRAPLASRPLGLPPCLPAARLASSRSSGTHAGEGGYSQVCAGLR